MGTSERQTRRLASLAWPPRHHDASPRDGRTAVEAVPDHAGHRAQGIKLNPQPGLERAALFLYREVLDIDLPWLNNINRPISTRRIPCVLTKAEVASLLAVMDGETALLARLLYGTGMRLRIKDVEFDRHVIIVREAKGNKDRVVMLPLSLAPALRLQMLAARLAWESDRQAQRAGVQVPDASKTTPDLIAVCAGSYQ